MRGRSTSRKFSLTVSPELGNKTVGAATGTDGEPGDEIRARQIAILHRQTATVALGNLVVSVVAVAVLWQHAPHAGLLVWGGLLWLFSLDRLYRWYRARHSDRPPRVSSRVVRRATVLAVLAGIWWGVPALFMFPVYSEIQQLFLALLICGMGAGAVSALAVLPSACLGFVVSSSAMLIARLLWQGTEMHILLAVVGVVYMFGLWIFARNSYRAFLSGTKAEIENRALARELNQLRGILIDALESASEGFALFDADTKLVYCNGNFRKFFPFGAAKLEPGTTYEEIVRAAGNEGAYRGSPERYEAWVERQLERYRNPKGSFEQESANGRWLHSSLRRTTDGGTVSTHVDVTPMKDREAAMNRSKKEAEAASRAKSEFLALMSHELRTPLNAIMGFAQILKEEMFGAHTDPVYKEYAADIYDSGNHLLHVISDILDLSKIEAGKFELDDQPVDLNRLIQSAWRMVQKPAEEAGLTLSLDGPEALPPLRADPRAVKQMLTNLLSNAVKFTPSGGSIGIGVRLTADGLSLSVRDTGIGIAKEDLPRVLEPFGQVERGLTRSTQGTGLGVPLVRSLIEMHDGAFEIESEPGKGTNVTLRFGNERIIQGPFAGAA